MKRKMIFVAVVVMMLTSQIAFGEPMDSNELQFLRYFVQSDLQSMEKILKENSFQMDLTALLFSVLENYMPRGGERSERRNITPFNRDTRFALPVLQLLVNYGADLNYGADPNNFSEPYYYYYFRAGSESTFAVQGMAGGWSPLEYVLDHLDFNRQVKLSITRFFLESGADIYKYYNGWYRTGILNDDNVSLLRVFIENGYNVNRATTVIGNDAFDYPLSVAVKNGQIATVRLLVESGAMVNRNNDSSLGGKTPAQWAYENKQIDIYNYLKQNGAVWSPPTQVASAPPSSSQQSRSTYNYDYDYTPPPSSSGSSSSSTPSRNLGKEIADAFKSPIQSGTYSLAGTQAKIRLTSIAKSGIFTYTNRQGKTGSGNYNIDGSRMTIQMEGYTYLYTVTSETSFSGNGENWVRTGY